MRRNRWIGRSSEETGPERDLFPRLPAKAPFVWVYMAEEYQMEFIGGLVGIRQDPQTLCLRPEIGWAVRDVPAAAAGPSEENSTGEDGAGNESDI